MKNAWAVIAGAVFAGHVSAADLPSVQIGNGEILAKVYLPDTQRGFYRGTRFDWSGVIYSLEAHGHHYYGPWFNKTDPNVHDFVYRGADIVAGPCSAITGPVDEYAPVGFEDAEPGGSFLKIGVGALRKPDQAKYDNYRMYDIANAGKRTIRHHRDQIDFVQELTDASSGFGYVYRKTITLTNGKSEMVLERSLKNTGKRAIQTRVYNHNFLVLDNQPTSQDFTITFPFTVQTPKPPNAELAAVQKNQIVYLKKLEGEDVVAAEIEGYSGNPDDHQVRIENRRIGAGLSFKTNRPLAHEELWSIRTIIAVEPFVAISVEPGAEFTWKTLYEYFTME